MIRAIIFTIMAFLIIINECYSYNNTEAQRQYDLAVSYIKSDLYEDGLKTLNQVAFLYPDSDVADDALYQLAMIREQVADGRVRIGEERKLETMVETLNRLNAGYKPTNTYVTILRSTANAVTAYLAGEIVFQPAKESAIVQYVLALDYLNTLVQRYPDSNRMKETKESFDRISAKIRKLLPKQVNSESKTISEGCITIFIVACIMGLVVLAVGSAN